MVLNKLPFIVFYYFFLLIMPIAFVVVAFDEKKNGQYVHKNKINFVLALLFVCFFFYF